MSDRQLGMTHHFLSEDAQETYSQARFDAIRTMDRVAKDEGHCIFLEAQQKRILTMVIPSPHPQRV
jgi:hypothetical protein